MPAEFRGKYGIKEGTVLEIEDTGQGLLLRKKKTTLDLLGTGKRPQKEIFDLLDKMRGKDER
jgi:bifunctional DNA-binding transcriptional regulator/antitoxin component of YhaV-PrlF toxin-antitoxin module